MTVWTRLVVRGDEMSRDARGGTAAARADLPGDPGRSGALRRARPATSTRSTGATGPPRRSACPGSSRTACSRWRWPGGRWRPGPATRARWSSSACGSPAGGGARRRRRRRGRGHRRGEGRRRRASPRSTSPRPAAARRSSPRPKPSCVRFDRSRDRAGLGESGRYPYTGRPWGESPLSRCARSPGAPRWALDPRRGVAQLAAQRSPKPQVAGSSPVAPATVIRAAARVSCRSERRRSGEYAATDGSR